jgi:hypothetical protein
LATTDSAKTDEPGTAVRDDVELAAIEAKTSVVPGSIPELRDQWIESLGNCGFSTLVTHEYDYDLYHSGSDLSFPMVDGEWHIKQWELELELDLPKATDVGRLDCVSQQIFGVGISDLPNGGSGEFQNGYSMSHDWNEDTGLAYSFTWTK